MCTYTKEHKNGFLGPLQAVTKQSTAGGYAVAGQFVAALLYMQREDLCKGGLHYAGRFAPVLHKVVNKNLFIHCVLVGGRNSFLRLSAAFWEFFKFFYFFKSC